MAFLAFGKFKKRSNNRKKGGIRKRFRYSKWPLCNWITLGEKLKIIAPKNEAAAFFDKYFRHQKQNTKFRT
jgi:hypothetical protein